MSHARLENTVLKQQKLLVQVIVLEGITVAAVLLLTNQVLMVGPARQGLTAHQVHLRRYHALVGNTVKQDCCGGQQEDAKLATTALEVLKCPIQSME